LPATSRFTLTGTYNRKLGETTTGTINGRFETSKDITRLGRSAVGAGDQLGDIALERGVIRNSRTGIGHVGITLDGDVGSWHWTLLGNYDVSRDKNITQEPPDLLGEPDRSSSKNRNLDVQAIFSGSIFKLPAGDVSASLSAGYDFAQFTSRTSAPAGEDEAEHRRSRRSARAIVDFPVARQNGSLSSLGTLSVNINAGYDELSDFRGLSSLGYGLSWSPITAIRLSASVTDEEQAPSVEQLGGALLVTPNVRVFDYRNQETVDVTEVQGGNPLLRSGDRRIVKVGVTVRPPWLRDLTLLANYTRQHTLNGSGSLPAAAPEVEATFPQRFFRNEAGRLIRIDARPINFARAEREDLRWGFNLVKRLPGGSAGGSGLKEGMNDGEATEARGARAQVSLYHTWRFKDRLVLRDGLPALDFLNGSAFGSRGGRARHSLETDASIFRNGLGVRISANWQSRTFVRGRAGVAGREADLSFSGLATVDLRIFANITAGEGIAAGLPFLAGSRISLQVDNIFGERVSVRDQTGVTPISFQPAYLDPIGRSARISFRKRF
jgi:hypothetical protein